jgi:hypothetical protein
MDDYIFLIIAIALSIFGAINQSKKKKGAENPFGMKEMKPRNFFMDQLLGNDFPEEPERKKPIPVRAKTVQAPIANKNNIVIQRGMNYQLPRFKSTLPDRPKRPTILTVQRQKEENEIVESEEPIDYLEDFSLRKAFIYSQILERKY